MYIKKYLDYKLLPAVGKYYNGSKKGKSHIMYTVDIGTTGNDLWKYFMKLGRSITDNISEGTKEVVLDKNSYCIRPIRNQDGTIIKDKLGNVRYIIEDDPTDAFKNDTIIFMEIPNLNYKDVKYEIKGRATVLAKAFVGKERDEVVSKSPALVIEVTGDFNLSYTAKDQLGNDVSGEFKYDYNNGSFTLKDKLKQGVSHG